MIRRLVGIYFSPIGGTARMTETLISELADMLADCSPEKITTECHDLLRMDSAGMVLDDETIAVIGLPVYVGKVPLPAVRMLQKIKPNGAITLAAVSYGARSFGNALFELQHFAEEQGFNVIGAGAFAVRYRQDENRLDEKALGAFGKAAACKIRRLAGCEIDGLRIKPMPLILDGRLPFHGISRISPGAAAAAQGILQKINRRYRDSEWYL
ncbi:MAG: hypothetical protein IKE85_03115 [Mogibacterium sp.]|nr:hypothetical protein [Mogibacterium sp.]